MSNSPSFHDALGDLRSMLSDDLEKMHSFISDSDDGKVSLITSIVNHLILAGGKRIRPMLLLASCKILGCEDDRRIKIASAIEFLHCATLLHDDVVDEGAFRRGVKTSNTIWGNKASILVGDFLLAVAFQWVVSCGNLSVVSVLSDASSIIVTGEIQQLVHSTNTDLGLERYIEIISAKTAALFSAACESAAVLHGGSDACRSALKCFGYNFGIAFQILDDILDYTATKNELGKDPGKDLMDKKVTLPLIVAYGKLGVQQRNELQDMLSSSNPDLHAVHRYMESCDAIETSRKYALTYTDKALSALSVLPDSTCKTKLIQLLQSSVRRQC